MGDLLPGKDNTAYKTEECKYESLLKNNPFNKCRAPCKWFMSETSFEEDKITHKDDERKHEHLLKDIPFDNIGFPYINVSGYSRMIISVGSLASLPYLNPVKSLKKQTECLRSIQDLNFQVTAKFVTGHWPLGLGFQRLGEFLTFLGNEEIVYERWCKLTISLPDLELPYNMLSLPILPLDALTNLRHLTWKGHRKQLLTSWLPLLPSILQTLTTLKIQCDIALQDCYYLLYHGVNLENVTLKIIQKGLSHEPVFSSIVSSGCMSRPLEYLCVVSDDNIEPLLRPFTFPSLHHIDFTLGYPLHSTLADLRIWKTLETICLSGDILLRNHDWIRSQCSATTQCHFRRVGPEVKGASSFLHRRSPFSLF
ncbi:hypothetical protein H2248_011013 [Termitomyces sp. 'cryptogamus']|nr:hypothetical protein H2248_011013 [Termitomyces sp. 'cryptogamus']